MMSRFAAESNTPVRIAAAPRSVKDHPDGADAVLDSATILGRISHADQQRTFPPPFQEDLSRRHSRGRLLDYCRRRAPIS